MYADPTPKINVKNKTPIKRIKELNIYSRKKVFLSISKYWEVSSKKLVKTVNIGITTTKEITKDVKYQILNFPFNIYNKFISRNITFSNLLES